MISLRLISQDILSYIKEPINNIIDNEIPIKANELNQLNLK